MIHTECLKCGGERQPHVGGHGWCGACYARRLRAGKPESGPPDPQYVRDFLGHLEDYRFIMETESDNTVNIAERMGVSVRSVRRYKKAHENEVSGDNSGERNLPAIPS